MRTWTFSQIAAAGGLAVLMFSLSFGLLTSCKGGQSRSSVLVIAVDQLGAGAVDCSKEYKTQNLRSGFEVLCREFSRWTHAYTTSTLTMPALTSMMTAEYPLTHGVHHNGSQFLPTSFETVAEVAQKRSWATLFISGGAPVLRKTGVSQGFEVFDDSIRPTLEYLHRPFQQSIQIYFNQLKEFGRNSSFSWIYVPDLAFVNTPTKNSLGEPRNLSFESQMEQFDEDLERLFEQMKKQNIWDTTAVVIVGLNSRNKGDLHKVRPQENLFSEVTQVALFIKWPGQARPKSSDFIVSLADVGATLFEWISGPRKNSSPASDFPVISLGGFNESRSDLADSRWLPMESYWAPWQNRGVPQWAFRNGALLCRQGSPLTCYNSFTDRDEVIPLRGQEIKKLELNSTITKLTSEPAVEAKAFAETRSNLSPENPCLQILRAGRLDGADSKKCEESSVIDLIQWIQEDQNPQSELAQKESAKKKFVKTYSLMLLDQKIEETNKEIGFLWDLSAERSLHRKVLEEALGLPEIQKYRQQAQRALQEL